MPCADCPIEEQRGPKSDPLSNRTNTVRAVSLQQLKYTTVLFMRVLLGRRKKRKCYSSRGLNSGHSAHELLERLARSFGHQENGDT
jgi:hypothetical protein